MEIKIDKNAVNTSNEYEEIKGLLKYECHCEWSVKNKFIVIDKSDKTQKDIWGSTEAYKEDIKKVSIWFEDFITYLLHTQTVTGKIIIIRLFLFQATLIILVNTMVEMAGLYLLPHYTHTHLKL